MMRWPPDGPRGHFAYSANGANPWLPRILELKVIVCAVCFTDTLDLAGCRDMDTTSASTRFTRYSSHRHRHQEDVMTGPHVGIDVMYDHN